MRGHDRPWTNILWNNWVEGIFRWSRVHHFLNGEEGLWLGHLHLGLAIVQLTIPRVGTVEMGHGVVVESRCGMNGMRGW